jgi:hypothetical protein
MDIGSWNPDQIWYGPNANFSITNINLSTRGAGGLIELLIHNSDGGNFRRIKMMHFTDINKELIDAFTSGSMLEPGTYLGRTHKTLGLSDGPHLHMGSVDRSYTREDMYEWLTGY